MGASFIDYLITDQILTPPEFARFYSEALAYLPETFFNADPEWDYAVASAVTREDCELPEDAFVFCAFHTPHKIAPDVFDVWMRLLREIPRSILWLREHNADMVANLRYEAESRGVSAKRLFFAPGVRRKQHLARLTCADLYLDTLPYNGGSSTTDGLMAGLPVLTCMSEPFVSRMGASMLAAVRLPELICTSLDEYYTKAYALACDQDMLAGVCARLAINSSSSILFDSVRFTRQLESLFLQMSLRYRKGQPPAMIGEFTSAI